MNKLKLTLLAGAMALVFTANIMAFTEPDDRAHYWTANGTTALISGGTIATLCQDADGCIIRLYSSNPNGYLYPVETVISYSAGNTWVTAVPLLGQNNNGTAQAILTVANCTFSDGESFGAGDYNVNFVLQANNIAPYGACRMTIID